MNYTKSNSYTEHAGTGQRMHDAAKAIPTQVSDSDLNMVIWSLMEIIKAADMEGVDFSADNADSYKRLLRALQAVYAPLKQPMFAKRDANLSGGQISLQAADNQQYKNAHIDFHGARMHLYATRKSDGKTVGGYIDLAQIGEGIVCLSDMAPAGIVSYFAGPAAPSGWMLCNGAAISRTVYARLFAAIGTLYGPGDGSTTFNLPDLRGEFIRSWDAGRGVDSGRTLGSHQGDAIRNITGYISGTGQFSYFDVAHGAFGLRSAYGQWFAQGGPLAGHNDFDFDVSRVVPTATENRPRNVALLPCIKY